MLRKKIVLFLVLVFTFVVSSFAGYFTALRYANQNAKRQVDSNVVVSNVSAETTDLPTRNVISRNTQIIKKHRYIKGMEYIKEVKEMPNEENIGMDMNLAERYYKDKGYTIIEFTPEKVILSKDIEQWPPDSYIVKGENGIIVIYKSDPSGNITKVEDTDIKLDILPLQDKEEVIKGKSYESMEQVEQLLEEYGS
jgi:hypothetical protein